MALKGVESLRRKLAMMGQQVRRDLEKAVLSGAEDIAKTAKHLAPRDSGDLQASIGATLGDPPPTSATGALRPSAKQSGKARERGIYASAYAGNNTAFYARWVEFGTKATPYRPSRRNANYKRTVIMTKAYAAHAATPAQPFFFPAYRVNKKRARARIARSISRSIKQAAKS